jgi:hypothetical protein
MLFLRLFKSLVGLVMYWEMLPYQYHIPKKKKRESWLKEAQSRAGCTQKSTQHDEWCTDLRMYFIIILQKQTKTKTRFAKL